MQSWRRLYLYLMPIAHTDLNYTVVAVAAHSNSAFGTQFRKNCVRHRTQYASTLNSGTLRRKRICSCDSIGYRDLLNLVNSVDHCKIERFGQHCCANLFSWICKYEKLTASFKVSAGPSVAQIVLLTNRILPVITVCRMLHALLAQHSVIRPISCWLWLRIYINSLCYMSRICYQSFNTFCNICYNPAICVLFLTHSLWRCP